MQVVFDSYTRRARLAPLLLTGLPFGLAVLALYPGGISAWNLVWSLVAWTGGSILLAELGRDLGKRKEHLLYAQWGGKPTTRRLRHRDSVNPVALQRIHNLLGRLVTEIPLPSQADEESRPQDADMTYDACISVLRNRTRDHKAFPLVFGELCSYGFRRNLWGLKPIALTITLVAIALVLGGLATGFVDVSAALTLAVLLSLGILLTIWLVVVRPSWVRVPAEAYAERLLEAADSLTSLS